MTRFFALISCLLLLLGLCIGASAAQTDDTRASSVNIFATVSSDGVCDVTANVTLHVDVPKKNLTYPLPLSASNVALNGKPVLTEKSSTARLVDLSRILGNMSGDFSFTVNYTLSSTVRPLTSGETAPTEESQPAFKRLQLELPMLAGFAYPIDELQFSINLPGTITQTPRFHSGYHQANIEKDLTYSTSGNSIAGRSWNGIKDHETLTMYLDTTDQMFPQTRTELPDVEQVISLVGICGGIALLFWLLFLPNFLPLRSFPAVAPDGFSAGQIGTILTMSGTDLNLMVFSWAQLGYVTLRLDRRGHVFLQKRMDMGNERTPFEQKCFYQLFSRRDVLDTASGAYQKMIRAVANQKSAPQLFRTKRSTGVMLFRVIVAAAGLLSGTCFGILLGNMLDYGWVFMLVLSAVGLFCSWHIQAWAEGLFLHHRPQLWIAAALSVLWLVLGLVINRFPLALLAVFIQIAGGFLATFGGRRTEEGRNAMGQTLALRRYMAKLTPYQAQLLCRDNPEAFFDLAPYAIALGCDNAFAKRFGKSRLPVCPYIQAGNSRGLTAHQWNQMMRYMLNIMATPQRRNPMDSLRSVTRNFMK